MSAPISCAHLTQEVFWLSTIPKEQLGKHPDEMSSTWRILFYLQNFSVDETRCRIDALGGQQFSETGSLTKKWKWTATEHLTFRPISLRVNQYASVHITSREKIVLALRSRQGGCKFLFQLPEPSKSQQLAYVADDYPHPSLEALECEHAAIKAKIS